MTDAAHDIATALALIDARLARIEEALSPRARTRSDSQRLSADEIDAHARSALQQVHPGALPDDQEGVTRSALYKLLTETIGLTRANAYAVNQHIEAQPEVTTSKRGWATWYSWPATTPPFSDRAPVVPIASAPSAAARTIDEIL